MLQILKVKKNCSNIINLCSREKKTMRKNYRKLLISSREKKTDSWKNPKKCPWKLRTILEKVEKSVRESDFSIREKSQKKDKNGFHGHIWFSREKENARRLYLH